MSNWFLHNVQSHSFMMFGLCATFLNSATTVIAIAVPAICIFYRYWRERKHPSKALPRFVNKALDEYNRKMCVEEGGSAKWPMKKLEEARRNLPLAEFQPRFVLISKELPVKEFELLVIIIAGHLPDSVQDQSRLILEYAVFACSGKTEDQTENAVYHAQSVCDAFCQSKYWIPFYLNKYEEEKLHRITKQYGCDMLLKRRWDTVREYLQCNI